MKHGAVAALVLLAVLLTYPQGAAGTELLMNNYGYLYETGGFPTSSSADTLTGVGVITSVSPPINCDLGQVELTWTIEDLVSIGQVSPDGGRTVYVSYSGGLIRIYCDSLQNHQYGSDPPNTVAPSTFEDGFQFLIGSFSQFVMFYDTQYQVGAFQGLVDFTNGSNLVDLPQPNGLIFAGTIGPALDPSIPQGYSLAAVGRIIAPSLCTVKGNVSFVYEQSECVKCKGITRLVLDYTGTEDPAFATVSCGAALEVVGNQLIITPDTLAVCSDDDDKAHKEHEEHYKLPKEIVVSVGSDDVEIHTSCSRPIDPGNVIGDLTVVSVDKILVPCEEEKCEGITRLALRYLGVEDLNRLQVSDEAYATVSGDTITILPTDTKLPSNTKISIGRDKATIHTSCSQPLEVGFVYGEFEVVGLDKVYDHQTPSGPLPSTGPVVGATVDLVDGEGNVLTKLTDENGNYAFHDVATESVTVSIVVPLGYVPLTDTDVALVCLPGDVQTVDFVLERMATRDRPRSVGFWKHQVNAALKGKQKGVKVTAPELIQLFAAIHERFDPYFSIFIPVVTLEDFKAVLSPKKPSAREKAERQFAALLLNVVSNRLSTWQFVSEDKATVSQAISYIAELIEDGDPSNDELAKNIAESIVEEESIPAGVIPLAVPQIAFARPPGDEVAEPLERGLIAGFVNYPNPATSVATISYRLEREVRVDLAIFNALGQKVKDLIRGSRQQGLNYVVWDGTDNSGRQVPSGVYFCRLKAGACAKTRRLMLVR